MQLLSNLFTSFIFLTRSGDGERGLLTLSADPSAISQPLLIKYGKKKKKAPEKKNKRGVKPHTKRLVVLAADKPPAVSPLFPYCVPIEKHLYPHIFDLCNLVNKHLWNLDGSTSYECRQPPCGGFGLI